MSDKKDDRRDRFSWGPGDVEIIKAPETKPARVKASPATGEPGAAEDGESPSPQGEAQAGTKKD